MSLCVIAATLVASSGLLGQPATIKLIPSPQAVSSQSGSFDLRKANLVLANPDSNEDRFAADQLQDELKSDLGFKLPGSSIGKDSILLGVAGHDAAIDAALSSRNLIMPTNDSPDAYVLSVNSDGVVLAGKSASGVFYGVQTLRQLVRANRTGTTIPCLTIQDWPALKYRGWQDDISRGPIPTLDYLKQEVRKMSELKQNMFTLYTEHVFKLKKHPTIAPKDGISAEEIKELSAYCKRFHVELIGNFQSVGHFANILRVPGYEKLGEAGWLISPAKEESYAFLKDVYDEVATAYDSPFFNINCDETGGLGTGASKEMVERLGVGAVYAGHISRIAELLRTHGKTAMMWGDIALAYRDIVPRLPKDLVVLSWGYDARDSFDDAIKPFTELGFRFMVCPGVSCWSQIFPDIKNASINISNYVRDGAKLGASGMLNTTWDDSGENLFSMNWMPLAWGAEVSWNPAATSRDDRWSEFMADYDGVFHGATNDSHAKALWDLSEFRTNPASGGMNDGDSWTPIEAITARGPDLVKAEQLVYQSQKVLNALDDFHPTHNPESLQFERFAARKAQFLGYRSILSAKLGEFGASSADKEQLASLIDRLISELTSLRAEYVRLWNLENAPYWLDQNLSKYDRLLGQLKSLRNTPLFYPMQRFLSGETEVSILSLDGDPVRFTTDGSEPTEASTLYSGPIRLNKTTSIKARTFPISGGRGQVAQTVFRALVLPAVITTNMNAYGPNKPENAFDGEDSTYFWREGSPAAGSHFTVTLNDPAAMKKITVTTGHPDHSTDIMVHGVLEVSFDGVVFENAVDFKNGVAELVSGDRPVQVIRIRVTEPSGFWLLIRDIKIEK